MAPEETQAHHQTHRVYQPETRYFYHHQRRSLHWFWFIEMSTIWTTDQKV